ncbi:MAG: 30S ribosomal protein S1 [Deltaproteobacteria bacterium]|nr:30S ribosomal protein S1 [Deltaproteobacteria bacterium]
MLEDSKEKNKNEEEQSFAELFEEFSKGVNETLQLGDKVIGKIISIGKENVFIETGTKIDGVVDRAELLDENQELPYKKGDILDLYVVAYDGGEIRLSKTFSGAGSIRIVEEAFEKAVPVEGKIKNEIKGGFHVEIMGKRAFCPISQIDLRYVENPSEYVGDTFPFLITQFEEDGKNIVVSRRKLLEKELEKQKQAFFQEIRVDTELEGQVTKIMPYGAFIEFLPGIEGMIHLSEMSWSRIDRPEQVLSTGDRVKVKVIGIGDGKRPGDKKLSLSIKQVTGDPWVGVKEIVHVNDSLKGKVTRCAKFGAFVEIAPGIEGLVHISEMSYTKRVLRVEDVVHEGDTVSVVVKEIDMENRRISLSMKDAEGDPWVDIENKYSLGQVLNGSIEKKERFGYFVSLEPGITGLLPKSRIDGSAKSSDLDKLREGDLIPVIVERIDPNERKISLAPADAADADDWKQYSKDSGSSIGSLGEKLRRAMKEKNG